MARVSGMVTRGVGVYSQELAVQTIVVAIAPTIVVAIVPPGTLIVASRDLFVCGGPTLHGLPVSHPRVLSILPVIVVVVIIGVVVTAIIVFC